MSGGSVVRRGPKCGDPDASGKIAIAKTTGKPCTRPAGDRTDHPGEGRCRWHGGCSLVKHGRYSKITREPVRKLIADFEADPDPLDFRPELAALRALFVDFINRYDETTEALLAWHASFGAENGDRKAKPRQVLDLADARKILAEISRAIERDERVKAINAISQPELYRFVAEIERVLRAEISDEQQLQRIARGIGQIRLRPNPV